MRFYSSHCSITSSFKSNTHTQMYINNILKREHNTNMSLIVSLNELIAMWQNFKIGEHMGGYIMHIEVTQTLMLETMEMIWLCRMK